MAKENKVYDTNFFKKQGSKGGNKVKEMKKNDPDFYKRNGLKGSKIRWSKKVIIEKTNERPGNTEGQTV